MRSGIMQPVSPERLYTDNEACRVFSFCALHEHEPSWSGPCFEWRLLWGAGLRISEALALRVPEDCKPDGRLFVRKSKTGRQRVVMCSPELKPYLIARLPKCDRTLFDGITSTRTLERWWTLLEGASGIEHLPGRGPHSGRHGYATYELSSRRLSIIEVQRQMGHASLGTTISLYVHADVMTMYEENKIPRWWSYALAPQKLRVLRTA